MHPIRSYPENARAILVLALPLIGSHLAQVALHLTDTVMLGWYGVEPLAAVVLGASSFFVLFFVGSGFANAVMPMVAAALGAGDEPQVRRDTRMGLWLSILFGLAVMPILWWSAPIFRALGQEVSVSALAQDYLRIAGWGMIPALFVMVLKGFLAALERTGVVLWATLSGVVLNACLNWALIFGHWGAPELGVRGAALASLATQILTLAVLVLYATRHPVPRRFYLFGRFWRADWEAFRAVLRLGFPIGMTSLAEGGLFQASALMMGWIGTVELAAHGIALEVAAITFMVHLGLANAATVRVGRAAGAGDGEGLRRVARTAIVLSVLFASVTVVIFMLWPEDIVGVFIDPANEGADRIVAYGSRLLMVAALFQLFDAMQCLALGLLRGIHDTRVPMWLASFSYWLIGIPTSYVLAFVLGYGGVGLWFGLVVGLAAASMLLMSRFWRRA